jgi:hypothetical protein
MSDTRSPDLDARLSEDVEKAARRFVERFGYSLGWPHNHFDALDVGLQRVVLMDLKSVLSAANHADLLAERERARLWIGYAMEELTAEQITRVTERAEYEGESLLDRVRVLEEALIALAAANDDYLLPDDDGDCCEPLFEKKLIRLSRDYCDEYTTVLTNEGREFIRRALASSLETDTEDGGRDGHS